MTTTPSRILIIAGSDSSGGAGIQADIKTVTMMGGYAMTAITAVTAQNTIGVQGVEVLPAAFVGQQINSCLSDVGADAVKLGMLGSADIIHAVADRLERLNAPLVFDPVMVATSGSVLANADTISAFERLISIATLVTPNVPELEAFGGHDAMIARGCTYLAKGGDAEGPVVEDRLVRPGKPDRIWDDSRIYTRHTHGTGCTLASAIAVGLGKGLDIETAIADARQFVRAALKAAPGFGAGHGPMGHQAVR